MHASGNAGTGVTAATLTVGGMSCGGCAARVEGRLLAQPGVRSAKVDLVRGRVVVEFDASTTTPARLAELLSASGYDSAVAS